MVRVMLSYFSPASHRFNLAAQISRRKSNTNAASVPSSWMLGVVQTNQIGQILYRLVINNLQLIFSRIGYFIIFLKIE